MASWILVPCLVRLRSEFNVIAPNRDKTSDGSIGDTAHQNSQSDHNPDETGNVPIRDADKINEVHAIDVDVDLRVPGLSMEMAVQFLLSRCRSGAEKRLRYIIYNRRIWSASNQWRQQTYTGANPHNHHAHFSSSYETEREASTASWHLEELVDVSIDKQDALTVWEADAIPNPPFRADAKTNKTTTAYFALGDVWNRVGTVQETVNRLEAMLKLERAEVPPTADQNAAAVITALAGRVGDSPASTAAKIKAALSPVLGDRAAEVFRLIGEAK